MKLFDSVYHSPYLALLEALFVTVCVLWLIFRRPKGQRVPRLRLPSWFLSSLDAKDRRLLLWCVGIAVLLAVATGFLLPNSNNNDNPLPSTYLAGQHGARAAYETLLRSGYPVERWERPLSELAATAGPETVVIFAQPFSRDPEDIRAVRKIVEKGGRVLSTGFWAGSSCLARLATPPKSSTSPPAGWTPRAWTRSPGRVRCGWFPRPPGRWATRHIASITVARAIPR